MSYEPTNIFAEARRLDGQEVEMLEMLLEKPARW